MKSQLKNLFFYTLLQFMLLLIVQSVSFSAPDGGAIFEQKCLQCHTIGDRLVGADLKNVLERRSRDWIKKWVKSPQQMIDNKDEQALELIKQYNDIMPPQNLSDGEIDAVLDFIEEKSKTHELITTATPRGNKKVEEVGRPNTESGLSFGSIAAGGLLFFIVVALIGFFWYKQMIPHIFAGGVTALLVLSFVIFVGFQLHSLGINQGYMPEQPIAFSHKIHAGDNKVPCLYCHFGAEKSRHAGIPPVNVCLNCHSQVKTDSPKIQQIYNYASGNNTIDWVKIHNLPDFVYFNHSQHVVVGKVKCQQCHGPIETMDKVWQFSTLTMGWCVECHRSRKVRVKGHENKTVAENGGVDCARCHY
jgi:cytochrome c551/c552